VRGLFEAAPGAWKMVTVQVLWPIIYLALLGSVASFRKLVGLERVLILAAIFIPAYGLLYMASEMGLLPASDILGFLHFAMNRHSAFMTTTSKLPLHGLSSMSFCFLTYWQCL